MATIVDALATDVNYHAAGDAFAWKSLGDAQLAAGNIREALASYEQALRLEPDNPELAVSLGVNLHAHGKLDRAVGYYRRALRLKPGDAAVSTHLAVALTEQGLLDEAVAQFRETLKFQPDHAMAYYFLSEMAAEGRYHFAPAELEGLRAIMASSRS